MIEGQDDVTMFAWERLDIGQCCIHFLLFVEKYIFFLIMLYQKRDKTWLTKIIGKKMLFLPTGPSKCQF